jgi:hypothetical protein
MSPVFKSGAFIQQCFSVHPLCLTIKRFTAPEHVVISCSSCQLAHRLTLTSMTTHLPGQDQPSEPLSNEPVTYFVSCLESHRTALAISKMDVVAETAGIRCAECRRSFILQVSVFETHQRDA